MLYFTVFLFLSPVSRRGLGNLIRGSKKRENFQKVHNQEIVFITQTSESNTLFPEKLKKVNKLLEKATFLPESKGKGYSLNTAAKLRAAIYFKTVKSFNVHSIN